MILSNSLAVIHVFLLLFIKEKKNPYFLEVCILKDERKISSPNQTLAVVTS